LTGLLQTGLLHDTGVDNEDSTAHSNHSNVDININTQMSVQPQVSFIQQR